MNKTNLLARYDKELRIHIMYPEARREVTKDIVRFVRPTPGMNFIGFTFASETELNRVIDQQLEYFVPLTQPFTWKVYEHDLLPSLRAKLASRNFIEDEPGNIMLLDLNDAPAYLFQPTHADIRRIYKRECLKDVITVLDKVYGNDNSWVYDRLGLHMQIPGYLSVYVAYVDDQPVSTAWTYFPKPNGHFATLYGGSTLAEHRGKGLYTSLLSVRLNEISERSHPFAIVEAGAMSKPIVAKHGFRHLTTVWDYAWNRNDIVQDIIPYHEIYALD